MINFYRKIRRKLADDNKPLKYARYAIGEIVLVVIGILIALSINNWNEEKKSEKLEIQYLHGLSSDLENDSIFFSDRISYYDTLIKNHTAYLIEAFENQVTYEEYLKIVGLIYLDSENFVSQNTTFMELTNSGKLNIFKNENLKKKLFHIIGFIHK